MAGTHLTVPLPSLPPSLPAIAVYWSLIKLQRRYWRLKGKAKARIPQALLQSTWAREIHVATQAALAAGATLKKVSEQDLSAKLVSYKGDIDLVTETDKENEKAIVSLLSKNFPTHLFIGEEEASANGVIPDLTTSPTWIIDPIDGAYLVLPSLQKSLPPSLPPALLFCKGHPCELKTPTFYADIYGCAIVSSLIFQTHPHAHTGTTNFVHGFPFSCVSIALAVEQTVVVGVVFDPFKDELFLAAKGHGAFLNGKQLRIAGQEGMEGGKEGRREGRKEGRGGAGARIGSHRGLRRDLRNERGR